MAAVLTGFSRPGYLSRDLLYILIQLDLTPFAPTPKDTIEDRDRISRTICSSH